jgi:methionyl-tRNA formyltransferase
LRIVFFGTTTFGIPTLKLLHQNGFEIVAVVTTPPRPQGRGLKLTPSPVEIAARELNLKVLTPENPNSHDFVKILSQYTPDCGVVVAYGFILREPLLNLPRYGFINLHPSLLPRYRGAAPIPRQLMDGCTESGITVIRMDKGVDSGDILNQVRVKVDSEETAGELETRLARLGADLTYTTLVEMKEGKIKSQPQNHSLATLAPKLTPADRIIDWRKSAQQIHNQIRALSPEPGAVTYFRSREMLILRSRLLNRKAEVAPGTIINETPGLVVATGTYLLELLSLKPAGKKILTGKDFRNGYRPLTGERLG